MARCFPFDSAELVVRVASCDFAAIGSALDVGATSVIVPQIAAVAEAERAVAATFYPPRGGRSRGELVRTWGRAESAPEALNAQTTCAVMIESAEGLGRRSRPSPPCPVVGQLFVGPHDLSLSLGHHGRGPAGRRLGRLAAAPDRRRGGRSRPVHVGAFAGSPAVADRFRAHGINCIAVATDLWIVAQGATRSRAWLS